MSNFRLFGLRNADDVAIRSIGQNVLLSHHVGRYGLGDSDKSRYESTTSILLTASDCHEGRPMPGVLRGCPDRRGAFAYGRG